MSEIRFLPGVEQKRVKTKRLDVAYLEAGAGNPINVVLIHGNVSCGWFFEELMVTLASGGQYHLYAPDMRGYGETETLPVDATRGVQDFSDDLDSFVTALGLEKFYLLGWSLGGNVAMEYTMARPETVQGLVLEAAGSPFGFGGSHGLDGTPNYNDFAGSGGGTANPDFAQRLAAGDASADSPTSPRNVMKQFYYKPTFTPAPGYEDKYVQAMLTTKVSPDNYPGDLTPSGNWPNVAPGTKGVNNTLTPKYLNQARFVDVTPRVPVLWIRGADDQIVSDNSLFDLGVLGQLGAVPGYPGAEVYPPQPMVSQLRAVLDAYKANGGSYSEVVMEDCGHSPHLEHADAFARLLMDFFGVVKDEG
jgi:pimeloyl-ACP methyl ester carboxylesterase